MKLDLSVDIDLLDEVYNPSDDSYLLLDIIEVKAGEKFLEMGSGSGLIAIHAAKAGALVTAADINPHAVECTRRNAMRNDVHVDVVESDLFENVEGIFDVIAFNPPYLAVEDTSTAWIETSWSGGMDGTEVSAVFLEEARKRLAPGGRIYMILSSLSGLRSMLRRAREHYQSTMIEEKHMFFESIFAYRFDPLNPTDDK
ncbi:TPA: methyltransferase [Thermoplasmata archaeon]|nr:methyltransferase [Thermoplasmata archaeon]